MRKRNVLLFLNLVSLVYSGVADVYEDFLSKPEYQLYFTEEKWTNELVDSKKRIGSTILKLPVKKEGVTYACEIEKPIIMSEKLSEEETEKMKVDKALEALEILKSLPCISYVQDWWSYEFCYKKHLTQFHVAKENDPPEHNMNFLLGRYPTDEEITNPEFKYKKEAYKVGAIGKSYISQWMIDGTICDITGLPRKTELRFYCSNSEGLISVKETTTCTYLVMINTPKICNSPGFEEQKSVNSIICHPLKDGVEENKRDPEQPESIPFPIIYKKKSVVQMEREKVFPRKIYKSKYGRAGRNVEVNYIDENGKKKKKSIFLAQNEPDEDKIKVTPVNKESQKTEDEEINKQKAEIKENLGKTESKEEEKDKIEYIKKRKEFLDALLPYASELTNVDEDLLDEVLNQIADTLLDTIEKDEKMNKKEKSSSGTENEEKVLHDDSTTKEQKTKAEIDIEVLNKEKIKSWIKNNEDKLDSEDMKVQVVLLDENGKKYDISDTDTDMDTLLEFLNQYGTDGSKTKEKKEATLNEIKKEKIEDNSFEKQEVFLNKEETDGINEKEENKEDKMTTNEKIKDEL